ncbi:MAG: methionine--tRNA ligase [Spirochaetales bacterium]|nr:methionine--tRNA ligase [Spirochaetales bacterium]
MSKRRLITSALPYVNNVPHLGTLLQVLSADVFARSCRQRGYDTLYICGTDEYGTATETRAIEEKTTPRELCDRYHKIHADTYAWFGIAFDRFGRTSTPTHTEITQSIFKGLDANGFITEKTGEQLYCENDKRFLADRYVDGTCPHCGSEDARGDQCDNCGKLLDPTDLKNPRCHLCGRAPAPKKTTHLYINLPKILPLLKAWQEKAAGRGSWAHNAQKMTEAWIRDGLKERSITRDLSWGIPVPKKGFEDKVFYVWFDAPIGYISITAGHTKDWEAWWKNPEGVELFQFIGKDNIPFHTVIFPSSLLGAGGKWTMLNHMASSEYMNYEGGKFSKSRGVGVFGDDAMASGLPADMWRFYLFYNRPEKNDFNFTWNDFREKVSSELVGNLSNLVNRSLTFVRRFYDGRLPEGKIDETFWAEVKEYEKKIEQAFEAIELRQAFRLVFELSSIGNKRFQDAAPWKAVTEAPEKAAVLMNELAYLVRDLAILVHPYLPSTSARVLGFLGLESPDWSLLGTTGGLREVRQPELLFEKLDDKKIEELRMKCSGQAAPSAKAAPEAKKPDSRHPEPKIAEDPVGLFREKFVLKVAKIVSIERHPQAEKLYIEKIDLGGGEIRQIVSGLVPYYREDDLNGKHVVIAANLKPAKLRGTESQGMLLAAEEGDAVEVIFAPHARPGDRVHLSGEAPAEAGAGQITVDTFFSVPFNVKDGMVRVQDVPLEVGGKKLEVFKVKNGNVH